ncbi:MBOAT family O-acyltransferase [Undibacterium parvum]|uniref:Probable alginate O-acetylase AlgI n=2 Tax=Undibacterium TaxID=401469 RepID=A0A6M4A5P2_9BURK|nr:MBOAT family O-acyltransferase [Undibacterium parvum]AZP12228.1 MBOAT family protein [Undibacterium parvum]QJQ06524.1 MBOAT family protein [Undibacterium piscinae]
MSFLSFHFLLFLAITFVLVHKSGTRLNLRNNVMLFASYYFYMCWDWRFACLLLFNTLINFFAAERIAVSTDMRYRKWWLWMAVISGLGVLAYFKYANFFIETFSALLGGFGLQINAPMLQLILPIGISFYTFQSLSYTLDVYRGRQASCNSFRDFALFAAFFPTVLSGPITRAHQLLPQLQAIPQGGSGKIETGLFLLLRGFIKKIAFADVLAVHLVNPAFSDPSAYSSWFLLLAVYAYSFQIYMDLSGYTDIARGAANLLGFELPINFNRPYLADSVSNFWQRWHISMSGFFRDYLYFSVGGSKFGNAYLNLFITFVAIGMWHGAGWNFIVYGLIHGSVICIERFSRNRRVRLGLAPLKESGYLWLLRMIIVFQIVAFSRILFRAPDLAAAMKFASAILTPAGSAAPLSAIGIVALLLAVVCHFVPTRFSLAMYDLIRSRSSWQLAICLVFFVYVLIAMTSGKAPFVYFQF